MRPGLVVMVALAAVVVAALVRLVVGGDEVEQVLGAGVVTGAILGIALIGLFTLE